VVSGDVAVVLRMPVALSSFLMMWGDVVTYEVDCHVIMRRHRGGGMDEGLLTS
jgi:hypothetical protein